MNLHVGPTMCMGGVWEALMENSNLYLLLVYIKIILILTYLYSTFYQSRVIHFGKYIFLSIIN